MASLIKQTLAGMVASVSLGHAVDADAASFRRRTDNAVAAWNVRTGETIWTYRPKALTQGFLEVRSGRLIVHLEDPDGAGPELDPAIGATLGKPTPLTPAVAKSHSFAFSPVLLGNGWRIPSFSPGNDTALVFRDGAGRQVWKIETHEYPEVVRARENTVFWTTGAPGNEATVHAQRAGRAKETWRFDVASRVSDKGQEALHAPQLEVVGTELYAQSHEHVFVLDAEDGSLVEHLDLTVVTGLPWASSLTSPAFYGGGLSEASMVHDSTTVIVAYERRVIALDPSSRKLRWHKDPGGFPSVPLPALYNGVLYLTVGTSQTPPVADTRAGEHDKMSAPQPSGQPRPAPASASRREPRFCSVTQPLSTNGWPPSVLLWFLALLLLVRRRRGTTPAVLSARARLYR